MIVVIRKICQRKSTFQAEALKQVEMGRVEIKGESNQGRKNSTSKGPKMGDYTTSLKNGQKLKVANVLSLFGRNFS